MAACEVHTRVRPLASCSRATARTPRPMSCSTAFRLLPKIAAASGTEIRSSEAGRGRSATRWIQSLRVHQPASGRVSEPVRFQPIPEGGTDERFHLQARANDGTPAEPQTFKTAVPNWSPGDMIHLGQRALEINAVRDDDADQPPTLVVEDLSEPATSEQFA